MIDDRWPVSRRDALKTVLGFGAGLALGPRTLWSDDRRFNAAHALRPLLTKPIPSSGEELPVVGIGTARGAWRSGDDTAQVKEVVADFVRTGGKVIDTAPSYGSAEQVLGTLMTELKNRDRIFVATKVDAGDSGREAALAQFAASKKRLGTDHVDLLQVHNMAGVEEILPVFRELKQAKQIRYLGVTTTRPGQYDLVETVLRQGPIDFLQINYAIDDRQAEKRILPLAKDRGVAVLTAMPFGNGRFFERFSEKPLPDWAKEAGIGSWAQFALKYVVANPAVVCAIPGTSRAKHLVDNLGAAEGKFLDEKTRQRMAAFVDAE